MILLALGTFHIEFKRPLIELELLCSAGSLSEDIIVQNGHTSFASSYFTMIPFIEPQELDQLYDAARVVITHAGTGSILKGVKKGKKVIAIPRLQKYREHIDDHQLEILNEFAAAGYILPWHESNSLEQLLEEVQDFVPQVYISQKEQILNYLREYIDSL